MDTWRSWDNHNVADVCDNGPNYMYSLICDYEKYIKSFGVIPINIFLKGWTCIQYVDFSNFRIGDTVYTANGDEYEIIDIPYESDDEVNLYVEVRHIRKDGKISSTTDILQTGDIYFASVVHKDYYRKKIKRENEEPLCPILITKTNQPQN